MPGDFAYIESAKSSSRFRPTRGQMCFKCSAPGNFWGMVDQKSRFFCKRHYDEWTVAAKKDPEVHGAYVVGDYTEGGPYSAKFRRKSF